MKRIATFFFALVLIFMVCISSSASDIETYIYEFDNVDVIFDEFSQFSSEKREEIAIGLVYGDLIERNNITHPENIICTIFGHNYETEDVITITHNVRDTQPTCLEQTFEIGICKRCGDTTTTEMARAYIVCYDH